MANSVPATDQVFSGSPASRPPSRTNPRTVLVVSSLGAFLAFLDATVVNVAFPDIRASFPEADVSGLSWVLNAYNIVFASFLIVLGRLADLLGRRRVFSSGILVFTAASVWCAVAPSLDMLITARVLQALGAAMLVPASLAIIVEAFPAGKRAHAVSLWGASGAVAAALGPPVGGALVELGGWRLAFLINLPVGLVAWRLASRALVESRAPGRRRLPDLRGAMLLAGALTTLTLGLVQSHDWGWGDWRTLAALGASVVLGLGFAASSKVHKQPLLDPALLAIQPFRVGNTVTAVAGAGFYAYMLTNVLWLQYVWGYDILRAGLALVPGAVVAAVVAARLGPVAQAHGYRRIVVPGALCWAAAFLWYVMVVGDTPAFWSQWLPGQVLSGIGVGATLPLLGSASLAAVPGGRFATASAVVTASRHVGGALGIALLVVVIGTPTPGTAEDVLRDGWLFCVATYLVTAFGSMWLRDVVPATAQEGDAVPTLNDPHIPHQRAVAADDVLAAQAPDRNDTYLARLPRAVRDHLEQAGVRTALPAGEWLFHEGEPAEAMYVVVSGRLEVVIADVVVRELGAGSILGELALLTRGTRSASVRARRDTTLLAVSREDFAAAVATDPEAPLAVATALAEQLQSPNRQDQPSSSQPSVVSVLALDRSAPVADVAATLAAHLRRYLHVHTTDRIGADGLMRAEQEHDRVVLSAGWPEERDEQLWWNACLRQADRVVLVARADAVPPPQWDGPTGVELVLVGPRPGTDRVAAWSQLLEPWQVTLVDEGDLVTGLRNLGTRLAGQAVGLVLAGGGARAFAHLGVLAELEEAGVVVDRVAGCSIGSVVAGLHAMGHDAATAEALCYQEFVRRNPFGDYTFPTASLAKGRRKVDALRRQMGPDLLIEALPRHFRCVSTDLLARRLRVHRSGTLFEAVAASARLPVLFAPLRSNGSLLVDGGILDTLPVDALTERDEGPVVAVNIGMGGDGSGPRTAPSNRPLRIPALGETLLRTMMIGSAGAAEKARASGAYVITPPTLGVGLLEFHQLDRMVEAGRYAARSLLEATGGDLRPSASSAPDVPEPVAPVTPRPPERQPVPADPS